MSWVQMMIREMVEADLENAKRRGDRPAAVIPKVPSPLKHSRKDVTVIPAAWPQEGVTV